MAFGCTRDSVGHRWRVQRRTEHWARQRAEPVEMDELTAMVSQSRAAIGDPYEKMHGRETQDWLSDDENTEPRKVRLHTGDQLPKRKKKKKNKKNKKNKNKRASEEDDDTASERAWRSMLRTTSNWYGASSSSAAVDDSRRMRPPSGSSSAVDDDLHRMRPPSGSSSAVVDESRRMKPPSGSSKAAAEKVSPQNPWTELQQEMSGRGWNPE